MSKKEKNKNKNLETMQKASNANYMAIMTAIAVVVVIMINLIVNAISPNITQIDLSSKDIFTLTDVSIDYLENMEQDVTIITLAETGQEYADLQRLLNDYAAHSDHIKLETKDPAKSPDIVSKYNANMTQGSLVVVCGDNFKTLELTDMVIEKAVDNDNEDYKYFIYDMEGQITRAIDYVLTGKEKKAYVLTGSGKNTLKSIETDIEKQNIVVEDINLDDNGGVPDDADLLIVNAMTKDFTDSEFEYITEFLDNGGSMFIAEEYLTIKTDAKLPNFDAVLERFGMSVQHVTVLEQNDAYYYTSDEGDYNFMTMPVLREHEITKELITEGADMLMMASDKIDIKEKADVKIIPLLESSGTAYYKSKSDSSYAKLNTDPSGTYTYAAAAVQTMDNGTEAKLIFSGSYSLLDRDNVTALNETLATTNTVFTVNSMKWLTGQEDTIYVDSKSKSYNRLVYTRDVDKKIGYLIVAIPVVTLVIGGMVWYRRRKK